MKEQINLKCTKRNYKCGKDAQSIMKGEENPAEDPKKRPLSSSSSECTPVAKMPNTQQSSESEHDPCTPGEEISMADLYHILTDIKNSQKQMKQDIQNEILKMKTELRTEMKKVKADVLLEMAGLRTKIESVETEMRTEHAKHAEQT